MYLDIRDILKPKWWDVTLTAHRSLARDRKPCKGSFINDKTPEKGERIKGSAKNSNLEWVSVNGRGSDCIKDQD